MALSQSVKDNIENAIRKMNIQRVLITGASCHCRISDDDDDDKEGKKRDESRQVSDGVDVPTATEVRRRDSGPLYYSLQYSLLTEGIQRDY